MFSVDLKEDTLNILLKEISISLKLDWQNRQIVDFSFSQKENQLPPQDPEKIKKPVEEEIKKEDPLPENKSLEEELKKTKEDLARFTRVKEEKLILIEKKILEYVEQNQPCHMAISSHMDNEKMKQFVGSRDASYIHTAVKNLVEAGRISRVRNGYSFVYSLPGFEVKDTHSEKPEKILNYIKENGPCIISQYHKEEWKKFKKEISGKTDFLMSCLRDLVKQGKVKREKEGLNAFFVYSITEDSIAEDSIAENIPQEAPKEIEPVEAWEVEDEEIKKNITPSENDLILQAQAGDEKAIEMIIANHEKKMMQIANKYFLPGADREDLYQEGRTAIFEAIQRFDITKGFEFSHLCYTVISNRFKDSINKENTLKQKPLNEAVYFDAPLSTEDSINHWNHLEVKDENFSLLENEEIIEKALSILTEREKEVFVLVRAGDTYLEISKKLDISIPSAEGTMERAIKKIRKYREEIEKGDISSFKALPSMEKKINKKHIQKDIPLQIKKEKITCKNCSSSMVSIEDSKYDNFSDSFVDNFKYIHCHNCGQDEYPPNDNVIELSKGSKGGRHNTHYNYKNKRMKAA